MGSGTFAVPSLEAVARSEHDLVALVAQPDKPAGRGHRLRMPKTKPIAMSLGIPVHQPEKIRSEEAVILLNRLAPDCITVVAYGQIIPRSILSIPRKGIVNVHGSLLPAYRGAAPIQWAIARGEVETGVTTMLMDEGLDTGPILLSKRIPIADDETAMTLEPKLADAGAELLLETLGGLERETIVPVAQDESLASLAPRIKKEHARIEWNWPATRIDRCIRAFQPWPGAFVLRKGVALKLLEASPRAGLFDGSPGTIVSFEGDGLVVACGMRTALVVTRVQAPDRAAMSAAAFARGRRLSPGDSLAEPESGEFPAL